MRFTSEISVKEICFLDLRISIDLGGRVQTDIFRKSTSTNSFLKWHSHHPEPLKQGMGGRNEIAPQRKFLKKNVKTYILDFKREATLKNGGGKPIGEQK